MTGPLTLFARHRAIKKLRRDAGTGLAPLDGMKSATVFVDVTLPYCEQTIRAVNAGLSAHGIEAHVYALNLGDVEPFSESMSRATFIRKKDVNWYGKIKRNRRTPAIREETDLFISLLPLCCFTVDYEARRSRARFKVGRRQVKDATYDLVVHDNESGSATQEEAFREMMKILETVR